LRNAEQNGEPVKSVEFRRNEGART